MKVRGTTELATWILGHGPYLQVLAPEKLRADVRGMLEQARALYG
jgi:hypothetical protein